MRAHTVLAGTAVEFIRSELGEEGLRMLASRLEQARDATPKSEFSERSSLLEQFTLFREKKIVPSKSTTFWENFKKSLDGPLQVTTLALPSPFKVSVERASMPEGVVSISTIVPPGQNGHAVVSSLGSKGQVVEEYITKVLGDVPNRISLWEVRERLNFAGLDSNSKYGIARIWVAEAARAIGNLPFAVLRDEGPFIPRNAELHLFDRPQSHLLDEVLAFTSFQAEEGEDGIDLQIIVGERALRDHPAQYRTERGHHIYQKLECTTRDMDVWVRLFHKFKVPTPVRPKIKITHQGCPPIFKEYRFLAMGGGAMVEVDKTSFDKALVEYNKALEDFEKNQTK